jgi:hypothetical protein
MKAKLRKDFTVPKKHGKKTEISIYVDYEDGYIIDLKAYAYVYDAFNQFSKIDLTPIFDTVPEFISIVDNIDWDELYSEYQQEAATAKAESHAD